MDLAAGAVGAVAGLLLHGKAKLVRADKSGGGDSGGLGSALLNAAASAVGLGAADDEKELTFMFNPTEYHISQSVHTNPSNSPGKPGGIVEYLGTSQMAVSMQLFFDDFASRKGDVTPKITKLLKWQMPQDDGGTPPPLVKFSWGNPQLTNFQGTITRLEINYTVFAKDGTPLQAKVDLTIEGDSPIDMGKNPTSHASDMRRVHTVIEGETIQSVAYAELGEPNYWRAIADANGIDDPLRVRPGRTLLIPSAADAARNA